MNTYPLFALVAVLSLAAAEAAPAFVTYTNARYGFSIAYPVGLVTPEPEAENGDGRAFQAKTGTARFLAYAGHILEGINDSPEQRAIEAEKDCPAHHASYRVVKPELVAISCATASEILYEKTILHDGLATTLSAKYPKSERSHWDSIVARMARSMTPARSD